MRIAVLVSGAGSNLAALLRAQKRGSLGGRIVRVLSSRPDARAVSRAERAGIATEVVDPRRFSSRAAHDRALARALVASRAQLVCLAGYVRVLTPGFFHAFRRPLLNVHPSLLPAFGGPGMYGRRIHEAVVASGARFSGCTVHFVTAGVDAGPIVDQEVVRVRPAESPESLARRVLAHEHRLYPRAVRDVATRRVRLVGGRVLRGSRR